MRELVVRGAARLRAGGWGDGDLVMRDGVVVDEPAGADGSLIDGTGLRAVPGFVNLQCNGGGDLHLTREPERLWELGTRLLGGGTTAWLPTICTSPPEVIDRALAVLAAGPPPGWVGAVPLGLHLEGPFLAAPTRGAHPEALLRSPSPGDIEGWSRADGVAMVTLAPEVPGALEVIATLVERGVVVSLGHSAATVAEVAAAVEAGASCITHLHNGMVPLHHRDPGLVGVALTDERLHVGLITDGVHVDPLVVAIDQRALGDRLVLVTDASPGTTSEAGAVRLDDGTLAGTDLTMAGAVRNLVAFTGCEPSTAIHAASAAPAAVVHDATRGTLAPGCRADVVLLDDDLQVVVTIVGGAVVHDRRSTG